MTSHDIQELLADVAAAEDERGAAHAFAESVRVNADEEWTLAIDRALAGGVSLRAIAREVGIHHTSLQERLGLR